MIVAGVLLAHRARDPRRARRAAEARGAAHADDLQRAPARADGAAAAGRRERAAGARHRGPRTPAPRRARPSAARTPSHPPTRPPAAAERPAAGLRGPAGDALRRPSTPAARRRRPGAAGRRGATAAPATRARRPARDAGSSSRRLRRRRATAAAAAAAATDARARRAGAYFVVDVRDHAEHLVGRRRAGEERAVELVAAGRERDHEAPAAAVGHQRQVCSARRRRRSSGRGRPCRGCRRRCGSRPPSPVRWDGRRNHSLMSTSSDDGRFSDGQAPGGGGTCSRWMRGRASAALAPRRRERGRERREPARRTSREERGGPVGAVDRAGDRRQDAVRDPRRATPR